MIAELGHFALILALLVNLLQGLVPWIARAAAPHPLMALTKSTAAAGFLLVSTAFAALIGCYILSDFTVMSVVLNSHSSKPLLYKITGAWGNHEGSMVLWAWVLSACGFLVAYLRAADAELKHLTLSILGWISAGFLAFILFTSNPFLRVYPPPPDGQDLNPILQDIGLAFHPPTLYIGYVGFGVVFAYAIAGLLRRRVDSDWARAIHPWILLPWSFLTLGIGAGSWWAYRELGWGGWWFWDPVENVSLLPWLTGTALLHSNLVLERRGQLGGWVVLLAILTFTMSLIGTFIVRSGLITSVHAFASDPLRGMFILAYIVAVSGSALLLYSLRSLPKTRGVHLFSRSGAILVNNLLLLAGAGVILVAILYPLALELLHQPSISIGPPYFNATFLPLTAALPFLAALAPLLAWDRTNRAQLISALKALLPSLLVALVIGWALFDWQSLLGMLALGLGFWLFWGVGHYLAKLKKARVPWLSVQGLRHLASATAHAGLAFLILGMGLTALLKQTYEAPLDPDRPVTFGTYRLRLLKAERREEANYSSRRATLEVSHDGHVITTLAPELRYYPVRGMETTEAALYTTPLHDLYVVLGATDYAATKGEGAIGIRLYVTPGQQFVWAGFLLAALGGGLGLIAALRNRKDH